MDCSLFSDILDNIRQDKVRSGAQNFTKTIPIRTKTSTSEIQLSWYKIKCWSFSKNQSRDPTSDSSPLWMRDLKRKRWTRSGETPAEVLSSRVVVQVTAGEMQLGFVEFSKRWNMPSTNKATCCDRAEFYWCSEGQLYRQLAIIFFFY